MNSYILLWNNQTWDEYKKLSNEPISYIAGNKLPNIQIGDEVFVVSVKGQRLFIGGRLISNSTLISRIEALRFLPNQNLISKDYFVIADETKLDYFRTNLSLDSNAVREIEIYTSLGTITHCEFSQTSFQQDFRTPKRISEKSAADFRRLLGIDIYKSEEFDEIANSVFPANEPSEKRVLREILARRGQPKFRNGLIEAYDGSCCITGCKVVELLEAAHINPHSNGGDYSLTNGVLLRSDIHTLFDQNLLAIDEYNRIRLSKILMDSEYKKYNMEQIQMPHLGSIPLKEALKIRYLVFLEKEANR